MISASRTPASAKYSERMEERRYAVLIPYFWVVCKLRKVEIAWQQLELNCHMFSDYFMLEMDSLGGICVWSFVQGVFFFPPFPCQSGHWWHWSTFFYECLILDCFVLLISLLCEINIVCIYLSHSYFCCKLILASFGLLFH